MFSYSQIDKYLPVINPLNNQNYLLFCSLSICPAAKGDMFACQCTCLSVRIQELICPCSDVYLSVFRCLSVRVQVPICPCSDVYLTVFRCLYVRVQMSICQCSDVYLYIFTPVSDCLLADEICCSRRRVRVGDVRNAYIHPCKSNPLLSSRSMRRYR